MNTSSLRRAGLLAAVAALLPVSAAAQSDAAFAAALQQGAPTPAQFAQVKKKARKPAEPAPAPKATSADEALWAKALETVKRDGKYKEGNVLMPGSFSIQESSGDPKGEFSKRAISVLGMINDEELFEPMGAVIVLVEAKRDPATGNVNLEQWMFQTDIYGEVGDFVFSTTTMSPDGKPLAPTRSEKDPADPKVKTKLDAMLKHWAERKPS